MKRPLALAATVFSAAALVLSGCGSDSLSTDGSSGPAASDAEIPAVEASQELHDSLPDAIQEAGVIQVGAEATYKPNEYLDGTEIKGMNPELFDAVAARLGVENNWNMAAFDSILAGVQAGKYDVGSSSFTITNERMETLTFVEYLNVGSQWATLTGNPGDFDPAAPCGKTVAYQTGTTQEVEIKELQETTCASDPMAELAYTGQDEVNNALMIGKADAMTADYPIVQNAIQAAEGEMEALGEQYGAAPYGFTMAKDNLQLAEAIAQALDDLKASGVYDAILDKYGVADAAVEQFPINPELA
ncbi:transporter substrate-binding domain-containing protein [Propionimicrobium sp. PCR01-08-3]|uniref:transporter substrate-binding domain-containing protein n=1 Tax=Propionimicrobium sp. PCR01-08-3 TaxID=3052086 RepID=UPI00255C5E56|nr:transporter substrate-binding domain-containing protein [Propionimicrobium sp. PCR01-08-3]WIY82328.1 transporter substrate-binding domain-containing protein [Propionimicrobium sp. PCR01-08-3]